MKSLRVTRISGAFVVLLLIALVLAVVAFSKFGTTHAASTGATITVKVTGNTKSVGFQNVEGGPAVCVNIGTNKQGTATLTEFGPTDVLLYAKSGCTGANTTDPKLASFEVGGPGSSQTITVP